MGKFSLSSLETSRHRNPFSTRSIQAHYAPVFGNLRPLRWILSSWRAEKSFVSGQSRTTPKIRVPIALLPFAAFTMALTNTHIIGLYGISIPFKNYTGQGPLLRRSFKLIPPNSPIVMAIRTSFFPRRTSLTVGELQEERKRLSILSGNSSAATRIRLQHKASLFHYSAFNE